MNYQRMIRCLGLLVVSVAVCGALPGEINGCGTDLSDEISHVEFCENWCETICERVITCGSYVGRDPVGDETIQDICLDECSIFHACEMPFLCGDSDSYISTEEANQCISDWSELTCDTVFRGNSCESNFQDCLIIETCTGEVLCDPPEWE